MEIVNYSALNLEQIKKLLPYDLDFIKAIIFPDICKVNWPLPTGVTILTNQADWRKFAISDLGCGMLFCESELTKNDFDSRIWDKLYSVLKNKDNIGDFTSGNHFANALVSNKSNKIFFLVHCGIKKNIEMLVSYLNNYEEFDKKCLDIICKAEEIRNDLFFTLQKHFGRLRILFNRNHNHFEKTQEGIIIRRGAVRIEEGDYSVIPSHIYGHTALIRAKSEIKSTLNSFCHGTGRTSPNVDLKRSDVAEIINQNSNIYIPKMINRENLIQEMPDYYRNLEDCLPRVKSLVEIYETFYNIAYLGKI
jgi:hypothetical protein